MFTTLGSHSAISFTKTFLGKTALPNAWNLVMTAAFSKYISKSRTKRLPLTTVGSTSYHSQLLHLMILETSGARLQEGLWCQERRAYKQQGELPHGQGDVHRARGTRFDGFQAQTLHRSRGQAKRSLKSLSDSSVHSQQHSAALSSRGFGIVSVPICSKRCYT